MTSKNPLPRLRRFTLAALAAAAVAVPIVIGGAGRAESPTEMSNPYAWFDPIIDIQQMIASRYVVAPDMKALQEAAIDGMLEALGDPYTEYVSTDDLAEFNKAIRGEYVGIGASVRMEEGWVTIVSPLEDSPAYRAGIMAGDRIVEVNGASTFDQPLQDTVDMLTGEPGTTVNVTIERGGERINFPIVRRQIVTRTVAGFRRANGDGWDFMIDPERKIGYVRVSQFTASTLPELEAAIRTLLDQGMEAMALDLRFDPGGLLPAATQMSDLFLDAGLIVSTKGRAHDEEAIYAVEEGTLPDFPLVVMVNRQSASASEIVAGALRDNNRAIILGTRTFGKGSVQAVAALPSGQGQLKITEQHYYGPSGRNIHRMDDSTEWGVDPSPGFYVPMTDQEYTEMLRVRREREVIRTGAAAAAQASATGDPQTILDELQDRQLAAAVKALRLRLERGEWIPTGEEGEEESLEIAELRRMQLARDRLLRELERVETRIGALSASVPEEEAEPEPIVADAEALPGGRIEIFGADGALLTTLEITGPGLERWLVDAPVRKRDGEGGE